MAQSVRMGPSGDQLRPEYEQILTVSDDYTHNDFTFLSKKKEKVQEKKKMKTKKIYCLILFAVCLIGTAVFVIQYALKRVEFDQELGLNPIKLKFQTEKFYSKE